MKKGYMNHGIPSRKQFRHYGRPRRKRERESLFKEIMAKNFKSGERDGHPGIRS